MLIMQLCSKRQATAIHDTGMVTIIADDIFTATDNTSKYALIYIKTGGKTYCIFFTFKVGKLFFQLNMDIQRSINKPASCTTCAILIESIFSCINHTLVAREACIGI